MAEPQNQTNERLLQARQHYASLEIPTHQLIPNGKKPRNEGWQRNATFDELGIESEWSDCPDANFGMPTDGLLVLDVDGADNEWLQSLSTERRQELFNLAAAVVRTPKGGLHFYYRQPVGRAYRNTAGVIGPKVDTRANGGFVVCVGSIVNGTRYEYLTGYDLDSSPDKWREPPRWLLDPLDGRSDKPSLLATVGQDVVMHEGGRNDYLTRTAGAMRRSGLDEAEILASLLVRNQTKNDPPLSEDEVRTIARSVSRYEPDQVAAILVEGVGPENGVNKATDPGPFPRRLITEAPGLMKDIINFNLEGAVIPQQELALAAAIAFLGMLLGQKVRDERNNRTNVYCLGLAESGEGKNRGLEVNAQLAKVCGMAEQVYGAPASASGMLAAINHTPVALIQIDEIGRFLRTIKEGAKTQPWMTEVISVLLQMYSSATGVYNGKSYSKEKASRINQPCVSLYGVSVPQSVFESFTTENLTDGFMSRLLIFEAGDKNPPANRYPVSSEPSDEIVSRLAYWRESSGVGNMSHLNPNPRVLNYAPEVEEHFWNAQCRYRELGKSGIKGATLWTRAAEKARKLALIFQCAKDHKSDNIELDAATWSTELVEYLTRRMIFLAEMWVADGVIGNAKASILRFIATNGNKATTSQLLKKHRSLNSNTLKELMETLLVEGSVTFRSESSGGRPNGVYELAT